MPALYNVDEWQCDYFYETDSGKWQYYQLDAFGVYIRVVDSFEWLAFWSNTCYAIAV